MLNIINQVETNKVSAQQSANNDGEAKNNHLNEKNRTVLSSAIVTNKKLKQWAFHLRRNDVLVIDIVEFKATRGWVDRTMDDLSRKVGKRLHYSLFDNGGNEQRLYVITPTYVNKWEKRNPLFRYCTKRIYGNISYREGVNPFDAATYALAELSQQYGDGVLIKKLFVA